MAAVAAPPAAPGADDRSRRDLRDALACDACGGAGVVDCGCVDEPMPSDPADRHCDCCDGNGVVPCECRYAEERQAAAERRAEGPSYFDVLIGERGSILSSFGEVWVE